MKTKFRQSHNAACESFFHTLKVEWVYQQTFSSIEQARTAIFWFIEAYYNHKRKHSTLGYCSPLNFELANFKLNIYLSVKIRVD